MFEILTKYTLLGIVSTILSGIADLGGTFHEITKIFIKGWIVMLETALTEFNETMTSFLNTETTGSTCPLFKLLIGVLRPAYINGAMYETSKALITLLGYTIGITINEINGTLTSLLNDENSVSSCLFFKFLTKLTTHISLRKYMVELPNIREYQINHRAFFPTPSGEHRNQDQNGNENVNENGTAETNGAEKKTERTEAGGTTY